MSAASNEDAPAEWWATGDDPHSVRQFWVTVLVFCLPAIAILFAGAGRTAWGSWLMLVLLLAGVVVGAIDWRRGRRSAVHITTDGPDEFVVRQVDGRTARYAFASVSRVRATRDDRDDTLSMRISVAGRVVRTRPGRDGVETTFLAMCREAGAAVTYRTASYD